MQASAGLLPRQRGPAASAPGPGEGRSSWGPGQPGSCTCRPAGRPSALDQPLCWALPWQQVNETAGPACLLHLVIGLQGRKLTSTPGPPGDAARGLAPFPLAESNCALGCPPALSGFVFQMHTREDWLPGFQGQRRSSGAGAHPDSPTRRWRGQLPGVRARGDSGRHRGAQRPTWNLDRSRCVWGSGPTTGVDPAPGPFGLPCLGRLSGSGQGSAGLMTVVLSQPGHICYALPILWASCLSPAQTSSETASSLPAHTSYLAPCLL